MRTSRVTGSFHLKQIVDKPTRKGAILDKILTNMADIYHTPEICSHLGKSDHNIITAIPCMGTTWKHRPCSKTIMTTRHVTAETKQTFIADLTSINWSSLFRLPTCQEQFDAFTSVLNSLIEEHFPTTTEARHSNDKPWVTNTGTRPPESSTRREHRDVYKQLRNKINRQRLRLRASFYQSKVNKIGESNSRQWWKTIKTMIGLQPSKSHLCDLAEQLCDGDMLALANNINMAFKEVSADLQRLYQLQLQLTTMWQTNLSSVSQTASRNYPSYVCTRLWGPIISRTGFSKTSPTFSLLHSQPSTTVP